LHVLYPLLLIEYHAQ